MSDKPTVEDMIIAITNGEILLSKIILGYSSFK